MKKFIIFALILLLIVHRTEGCVAVEKHINFDGRSDNSGCINTQIWYGYTTCFFCCDWVCGVGINWEFGFENYYLTICTIFGCFCEASILYGSI